MDFIVLMVLYRLRALLSVSNVGNVGLVQRGNEAVPDQFRTGAKFLLSRLVLVVGR